MKLLTGPTLPRAICPVCAGERILDLSLGRPRPCVCCRGTGLYVSGRYDDADPTDARAFELGLHPRIAKA